MPPRHIIPALTAADVESPVAIRARLRRLAQSRRSLRAARRL
ncbi:hypothetical protein [Sphingomonas sp. PR090111-T3T-6A]|nr:hypothetical protein [Sphingomonas sp. PR090111-T3T-6A]